MNFSQYCLDVVCKEFFHTLKTDKSRLAYLYAIKEFLQEYPEYEDFTKDNCIQFLEDLQFQKGQKYSTVVKKKKQLSSFFNFLASNLTLFTDIPPDFVNFFSVVPLPPEPEVIHVKKVISIEELDNLITYLREHSFSCMIAVILAFKLMLRTSEILSLKWKDVIETKDGYLLRITSGENRYLSLPPDIFSLIMDYEKIIQNSEFLFPSPRCKDTTITPKALNNMLTHAEKELDMTCYTFNDLRNAGISFAMSQHCSINLLLEQLNMKSKSHISRLKSLSSLTFPNASSYTNIVFKGTPSGSVTPNEDSEDSVDSNVTISYEQLIQDMKNYFDNGNKE